MKALINPLAGSVVCDLSQEGFPVAPPLFWVDAPEALDVTHDWSYDGRAFTPPDTSIFVSRKVAKYAAIEQWRDEARYANVTVDVNGAAHPWQIDPISSQLILSAATNNKVFGFPLPPTWRTADNIDVPIGINDLAAIIAAGAIQTQMAYAKSWALKAQVAAASSQAELDAIVW